MTHANQVPVKLGGMDVGTARVNEDGTIELAVRPTDQGRELLLMIQANLCSGLSMFADMLPASDSNVIPLNQAPSKRAQSDNCGFRIRDCMEGDGCLIHGDSS